MRWNGTCNLVRFFAAVRIWCLSKENACCQKYFHTSNFNLRHHHIESFKIKSLIFPQDKVEKSEFSSDSESEDDNTLKHRIRKNVDSTGLFLPSVPSLHELYLAEKQVGNGRNIYGFSVHYWLEGRALYLICTIEGHIRWRCEGNERLLLR